MADFISKTILLVSFFPLILVLCRKMPALRCLPKRPPKKKKDAVLKIKERIRELNPFKDFSKDMFLEKILRKSKILALKAENKISKWLGVLKTKSAKREENNKYWQELKKIKRKKVKNAKALQ